jgi:hypothetical protein
MDSVVVAVPAFRSEHASLKSGSTTSLAPRDHFHFRNSSHGSMHLQTHPRGSPCWGWGCAGDFHFGALSLPLTDYSTAT